MSVLLPQTNEPCESLVDVLQFRANLHPDRLLFRFLEDANVQTLTYAELAARAESIALKLKNEVKEGDRALLIYPPGLDFTIAFFGCLYAGVIAVPVYPPTSSYLVEKCQKILENSRASILLTTRPIKKKLDQLLLLKKTTTIPLAKKIIKHYLPKQIELTEWDIEQLRFFITDELINVDKKTMLTSYSSDQLAFLQYTSGSTGDPKGVMLSHGNLLHNMSLLRTVCDLSDQTEGGSWLPPYHDMGLIGFILTPVFLGCTSTLISPYQFLKKPSAWLKMISEYKITISAAPNFAYDYCINKITEDEKKELDLSSWKNAINGAEPVRYETLERFYEIFKAYGLRKQTLFPSYGLAEATLFVSGHGYTGKKNYFSAAALKKNKIELCQEESKDKIELVNLGVPAQTLVIIDPDTLQPCDERKIGEIWLTGPSVAQGYWQKEKETNDTFKARLVGSEQLYLRTGDLGFLHQQELYVTGRLKDLIIIRGLNYYPQDLEDTVNHSHELIRSGGSIAFSTDLNQGEKLIIVSELLKIPEQYQPICDNIANALLKQHELTPYAIVLIKNKDLPKTSSGKLRRHFTKALYEQEKFPFLFQWRATNVESKTSLLPYNDTQKELVNMCSILLERPVGIDEPFAQLGVDSLLATQILSRIRDRFDIELPIQKLFSCKNIIDLAILIDILRQNKKNGQTTQ